MEPDILDAEEDKLPTEQDFHPLEMNRSCWITFLICSVLFGSGTDAFIYENTNYTSIDKWKTFIRIAISGAFPPGRRSH